MVDTKNSSSDAGYLEVYQTTFAKIARRSDRWRWRFVHTNGNILAQSSEGYASKATAEEIGEKVVSGVYCKQNTQ